MLTLKLIPHHLQMDWTSLDPKDEKKIQIEDSEVFSVLNTAIDGNVSKVTSTDAEVVAISIDQNSKSSQPVDTLQQEMTPQAKPNIVENEGNVKTLSPAAPSTAVALGPNDTESINNILKTFQNNCFINSSILKPAETSTAAIDVNEIEQMKNGSGDVQESALPPLKPTLTDVDFEAELPSTSIQLKKKPPRQRKKVENKEEAALQPSVHVLKPNAKRSTKRKTNYRETSSDEEPKFVASSRRRPNNKSPKDLKKNINVSVDGNENTTVKLESQVKTELNSSLEATVNGEVVALNLEAKSEPPSLEVKSENGIDLNNTVQSSLLPQNACKSEPSIDGVSTPLNGEVKEENGVATAGKRVRNPVTARRRKPKRIRFTTMAAARNRTRLHPLTRQEQLMMNKFMETQEPFLQKIPCLKLSSKISKCRECRCASIRSDSVFCRFYDFRRLRFKDKGVLVVDGFSDPHKDPGPSDIETWMLGPPPKDIDLEISRYILMHVGDQFCRIWQDEQTAIEEHISPNKTIAWKKAVKGVREICDVCEATLFNFHWTCNKCGFGVCLDCYRDRKNKKIQKTDRPARGSDEYGWLLCATRENHDMIKLMLTQIIPGNALNFLANRLHQACKLWKIPQKCGCPLSMEIHESQFAASCVELADQKIRNEYLRFYARECEIKYLDKIKVLDPKDELDHYRYVEAETQLIEEASEAGLLPQVLATTLKHLKLTPIIADSKPGSNAPHLLDEVTKEFHYLLTKKRTQKSLPQKVMTLRASKELFPGIAHDWLCNGKLLRLLDSRDPRNALIFKEYWKRGQPIMVSELSKFLNIKLWHPEAFCADFGEKRNDLINCMTGNLVPNQPMKLFWEGFQCVSKRLLDASGQPMLLKLKDWPPGDDFAEILPTRYKDLMSALPLPEYTLRTGGLNIASRLPAIFVPPDLGPKMYNAYGSALHPDKGTTNLHLDISDAVNIMVYVGIPTDASAKDQIKAALSAIDGGGCDILQRQRVRQPGVMPGALWHIYSARDADKIRDLLNRVTIERGYRLEPDHDPIHDQNWYLDNELRERLYDDYGVEGYPIAQCLGDAVFIPAGAPHQVRNLHNCIKVAEDFVSPENIQHCFHLSQQFRKLSMSHTNHEDKLQIRNVIYHSIKDTTSYLTYLLNQIM